MVLDNHIVFGTGKGMGTGSGVSIGVMLGAATSVSGKGIGIGSDRGMDLSKSMGMNSNVGMVLDSSMAMNSDKGMVTDLDLGSGVGLMQLQDSTGGAKRTSLQDSASSMTSSLKAGGRASSREEAVCSYHIINHRR